MNRSEIYRTQEKPPERGHKPGFYLVISRDFIADSDDVSTVICTPVYRALLGLRSEFLVGANHGFPQDSAIRCDFLTLMMKKKLTHFVGTLSDRKQEELNRALAYALQLNKS